MATGKTPKVTYEPATDRYDRVDKDWFRRCGKTGLMLPAISLGLWHNFGDAAKADNARRLCFTAFDRGITHFDLANNYGPPPGSAESRFGKILKHLPREELVISTKAGYKMWPGPYGDWGSRKYLLSSLDASLKRLKLDHVDIFYHHRWDPKTPLDETMGALDQAVKSGKAIYAGVSNYGGNQLLRAVKKTKSIKANPLLINQVCYNMLQQGPREDMFETAKTNGVGVICFCPLAQGLLTDRYLGGEIPKDSRAADITSFLKPDRITTEMRGKLHKLNDHARSRGQTLAEMALSWVLSDNRVTSCLIGASKPEQIEQNVKALSNTKFTGEELKLLNDICNA
ncbi:MAG: L-glyceraldehyde 3-phosphate reductase [Phycisphaeraceae bacterium]|nr:L-glyceraldehyde 3-phosphate reductase [Phycisphaeraceae bacterium]